MMTRLGKCFVVVCMVTWVDRLGVRKAYGLNESVIFHETVYPDDRLNDTDNYIKTASTYTFQEPDYLDYALINTQTLGPLTHTQHITNPTARNVIRNKYMSTSSISNGSRDFYNEHITESMLTQASNQHQEMELDALSVPTKLDRKIKHTSGPADQTHLNMLSTKENSHQLELLTTQANTLLQKGLDIYVSHDQNSNQNNVPNQPMEVSMLHSSHLQNVETISFSQGYATGTISNVNGDSGVTTSSFSYTDINHSESDSPEIMDKLKRIEKKL